MMTVKLNETQPAPVSERELTQPVALCDQRGRLNPGAVGWSRRPLHTCNLRGAWLRKKRWNYWCVTTDQHLFSVTLSNIDYSSVAFVYLLEYATGRFYEKTVISPKQIDLPPTVMGQISFRSQELTCSIDDEGERTRIDVECPRFGPAPLRASLSIARPANLETMNVVIPWSDRRFQFTSKQLCLPAIGLVELGAEPIALEGFACLDYGRGIWPYKSIWNWGAFSGRQNGRTVGVNLGGRWTDGTGYTENAVLVDGRLSKLGETVQFAYDRRDFQRPWRVQTVGSGRVDLTFTPFFERVAKTNMLVVRSEVHQMIGRYSGSFVTDDGERIEVRDMIGWAEDHRARW